MRRKAKDARLTSVRIRQAGKGKCDGKRNGANASQDKRFSDFLVVNSRKTRRDRNKYPAMINVYSIIIMPVMLAETMIRRKSKVCLARMTLS